MSHSSRVSSKSSSKKHGGAHSSSRGKGNAREEHLAIVSFIFMVNELRYHGPDQDIYYNYIPPTNPHSYTHEIPSLVMRYQNGNVTEANGFQWERGDQFPAEGKLWTSDPATGQWSEVVKYKTFAVFACNSHLPIMVCPHDPLFYDTRSNWQLLQLFHPRERRGVSQVATEDSEMENGPGLVRHAAGSRPSWIPSLLPFTYSSTIQDPPSSRGLGGELPIILGLMALSAEPDETGTNNNTNGVFLGYHRKWHWQQWANNEQPRGYPRTDRDDPRGFLVNVFYDPHNPDTSTEDFLRYFEWSDVIVRESRS